MGMLVGGALPLGEIVDDLLLTNDICAGPSTSGTTKVASVCLGLLELGSRESLFCLLRLVLRCVGCVCG
jgi:hypothetical protein